MGHSFLADVRTVVVEVSPREHGLVLVTTRKHITYERVYDSEVLVGGGCKRREWRTRAVREGGVRRECVAHESLTPADRVWGEGGEGR